MDSLSGSLRLERSQCYVPRAVFCSQSRDARVWSKGADGDARAAHARDVVSGLEDAELRG